MTYNTKQKNEILAFFKAHPDKSFTLDSVIEALQGAGIGKSTVYRLASALTEEGILRKARDGIGRKSTYQLVDCHDCHSHFHLKCRMCGRLVHLDEELSHRLEERVMSEAGFLLDDSTLLYGRCESCSALKP